MKNKGILVVLGSPNTPEGELSAISKSRLKYCKNIFTKGNLIVCTGGWGEHFNIAKHAHAYYAKTYLIKQGLSENAFLDFALSKHTVDDAVKLIPILEIFKNLNVTIITSDYHLERVQLIFTEILNDHKLKFIGVASNLNAVEYEALMHHEETRILAIKGNGLYY